MVQFPWRAHPSGWSTGLNDADRTFVDLAETVGQPTDAAATDVAANNSMMALLKGIATKLEVSAGAGTATTFTGAKVFPDLTVTLGSESDARATDTGSQSAIALLKGTVFKLVGA